MKKKLKILIVAPEVAPFSKTNIIAEVIGSYATKLKEIGHDVRIITPQYRVVNERKYTLRDVIRLKDIDVTVGNEVVKINVKSSFLPDTKVQVYFIDYKPYFFREGLYRDPQNQQAYSDNHKRFTLFSKSVMETLKKLQWQPDVIHCNEWQTGLIPFFLKFSYKKDSFFRPISTLYTIRDFTKQGSFKGEFVSFFGLDQDMEEIKNLFVSNGNFNFLKAGIQSAHCVNSTSSKYVKQVESEGQFKDLFKSGRDKLNHVEDQVDFNIWNPEQDSYIPTQFTVENLEDKEKNKKALLEEFNLQFDDKKPVCSFISSFIDMGGEQLLKDSFDACLDMNLYLIILTSREDASYEFYKKMKKKYKNRIGLQEYYDASLEHLTVAGSDIMLLPSQHDPTGSSPVYSLRYGTVPIVYRSGDIAEIITHHDNKNNKGNGFIFNDYNRDSFLLCIKNALKFYNDREHWLIIEKNCMTGDYLKHDTIKKYEKLYNKCIKNNNS